MWSISDTGVDASLRVPVRPEIERILNRGGLYLFSIDLEDVRLRTGSAGRFRPRVAMMTERYLSFLRRHRAVATFFVVGDVARAYPGLVRRIVGEGHEVACHSDRHVPLDRQDAASFRDDLRRNLEALRAAGAEDVLGFRAPCFSLTAATSWAYEVLAELGFRYSSSVLPARNPLYGWPEFGPSPRAEHGVWELPVTLLPSRILRVPMGGGVYFRVLPERVLRSAFRARLEEGEPVLGYLHPYNVDGEQERFAHPGFSRWSPYNALMYVNRKAVFRRLEMVMDLGFRMCSYRGYVESGLSPPPVHGSRPHAG